MNANTYSCLPMQVMSDQPEILEPNKQFGKTAIKPCRENSDHQLHHSGANASTSVVDNRQATEKRWAIMKKRGLFLSFSVPTAQKSKHFSIPNECPIERKLPISLLAIDIFFITEVLYLPYDFIGYNSIPESWNLMYFEILFTHVYQPKTSSLCNFRCGLSSCKCVLYFALLLPWLPTPWVQTSPFPATVILIKLLFDVRKQLVRLLRKRE